MLYIETLAPSKFGGFSDWYLKELRGGTLLDTSDNCSDLVPVELRVPEWPDRELPARRPARSKRRSEASGATKPSAPTRIPEIPRNGFFLDAPFLLGLVSGKPEGGTVLISNENWELHEKDKRSGSWVLVPSRDRHRGYYLRRIGMKRKGRVRLYGVYGEPYIGNRFPTRIKIAIGRGRARVLSGVKDA